MGGAYIESGIRKFADWSKTMIEALGKEFKPYLRGTYENLRYHPDVKDTTGMSSPAEIDESLTNNQDKSTVKEEGRKMANYKQMLLTGLKQDHPGELAWLKKENELTEFLTTAVELYENLEQRIFSQMTEKLPENYLERVKSLEQAQAVAVEATTQDLTEFLDSL